MNEHEADGKGKASSSFDPEQNKIKWNEFLNFSINDDQKLKNFKIKFKAKLTRYIEKRRIWFPFNYYKIKDFFDKGKKGDPTLAHSDQMTTKLLSQLEDLKSIGNCINLSDQLIANINSKTDEKSRLKSILMEMSTELLNCFEPDLQIEFPNSFNAKIVYPEDEKALQKQINEWKKNAKPFDMLLAYKMHDYDLHIFEETLVTADMLIKQKIKKAVIIAGSGPDKFIHICENGKIKYTVPRKFDLAEHGLGQVGIGKVERNNVNAKIISEAIDAAVIASENSPWRIYCLSKKRETEVKNITLTKPTHDQIKKLSTEAGGDSQLINNLIQNEVYNLELENWLKMHKPGDLWILYSSPEEKWKIIVKNTCKNENQYIIEDAPLFLEDELNELKKLNKSSKISNKNNYTSKIKALLQVNSSCKDYFQFETMNISPAPSDRAILQRARTMIWGNHNRIFLENLIRNLNSYVTSEDPAEASKFKKLFTSKKKMFEKKTIYDAENIMISELKIMMENLNKEICVGPSTEIDNLNYIKKIPSEFLKLIKGCCAVLKDNNTLRQNPKARKILIQMTQAICDRFFTSDDLAHGLVYFIDQDNKEDFFKLKIDLLKELRKLDIVLKNDHLYNSGAYFAKALGLLNYEMDQYQEKELNKYIELEKEAISFIVPVSENINVNPVSSQDKDIRLERIFKGCIGSMVEELKEKMKGIQKQIPELQGILKTSRILELSLTEFDQAIMAFNFCMSKDPIDEENLKKSFGYIKKQALISLGDLEKKILSNFEKVYIPARSLNEICDKFITNDDFVKEHDVSKFTNDEYLLNCFNVNLNSTKEFLETKDFDTYKFIKDYSVNDLNKVFDNCIDKIKNSKIKLNTINSSEVIESHAAKIVSDFSCLNDIFKYLILLSTAEVKDHENNKELEANFNKFIYNKENILGLVGEIKKQIIYHLDIMKNYKETCNKDFFQKLELSYETLYSCSTQYWEIKSHSKSRQGSQLAEISNPTLDIFEQATQCIFDDKELNQHLKNFIHPRDCLKSANENQFKDILKNNLNNCDISHGTYKEYQSQLVDQLTNIVIKSYSQVIQHLWDEASVKTYAVFISSVIKDISQDLTVCEIASGSEEAPQSVVKSEASNNILKNNEKKEAFIHTSSEEKIINTIIGKSLNSKKKIIYAHRGHNNNIQKSSLTISELANHLNYVHKTKKGLNEKAILRFGDVEVHSTLPSIFVPAKLRTKVHFSTELSPGKSL